jgi:diaminohydroxyphosphoribosylaminopyrimidine deaminase / 5-amino-6-(5-phosphoribosylamino)uracil reductase
MDHKLIMRRCLDLAGLGAGQVAPNPMVGCVIVHQGKVIGEGFHQQYGEAHAEVNAINSVNDPSLLSKSTLYVNLEPCAHFGKTPPCAHLIIEHQIPKVVIGCSDSFEEVNGAGIAYLKEHGVNVKAFVMEEECRHFNRRFFTFHEKKSPYVILKWAQSLDGYIDALRGINDKGVHWISSPESKRLTHRWRSEEAAILVGTNTALTDNPSLTVREYPGRNPLRILIDRELKVATSAAIFNSEAPTLIFNERKEGVEDHLTYIKVDFSRLVNEVLKDLYKRNIQSVIVEGGAKTLNSFIETYLWDEARVLTGNVHLGQGLPAPKLEGNLAESTFFGTDRIDLFFRP